MLNDPFLQTLLALARPLRDRLHGDGQDRERGALSIELALLVAALVVLAGIIVAILIAKVTAKGNAIG
jgi:hypothetical protein